MPLGTLTGLAGALGGGGVPGAGGFTDTGSAVSGATLGPVTIGGLNPPPAGFELTPATAAIGAAVIVGTMLWLRGR